jgi:hypothetical protein
LLVLAVKYDTLKLLGQAADLSFVLGLFDLLQTSVQSLPGGAHEVGSGSGIPRFFFPELAEFLSPHVFFLKHYRVAAFAFRPTCLNRSACTFAALFGS